MPAVAQDWLQAHMRKVPSKIGSTPQVQNPYYVVAPITPCASTCLNPLSPFGRGVATQNLAYSDVEMCVLRENTKSIISDDFEIIYIRFPNTEHKPIGRCPLGSILYAFCNGDVAICPYLVFAANGDNNYEPKDFIIGNIIKEDMNFTNEINKFHMSVATNPNRGRAHCSSCSRGCYAIKISNGQELSDCDFDMCPVDEEVSM